MGTAAAAETASASPSDRALRGDRADLADIRRCLGGEREAYRRLIERHQEHVSAIVWRFSRDPDTHEDLVHDVFVEAYCSLGTYRAEAPFAHWLARIATRVGYRHWEQERRERAVQMVPLGEWEGVVEEARDEDDLGAEEAADLLRRLLAQLPPRDRLVVTLRYMENRSVEETAALTGWSKTMVKVQAWRARKKLVSLFEQATGEVAQ